MHHCTYVLVHKKTLHIHTHARIHVGTASSFAYMRLQIYARIHTVNAADRQAEQVSRSKPPLSNERELSKRTSEREKVTAEAENHSLPRFFGKESMHPSQPAKNLLFLVLLALLTSLFYSLLLLEGTSGHVNTELRARCEKELEIARFTYQRISILIP